jgi:hypothetical protein
MVEAVRGEGRIGLVGFDARSNVRTMAKGSGIAPPFCLAACAVGLLER